MRNVRMSVVVAGLAACLVIGSASPAFAEAPRPVAYVAWSDVATMTGQGDSPHGGYDTTTVKCAVCHAVHNAEAMGELLLQDTAAGACNYCHVNSAVAYTQVYGSNSTNYQGADLPNAHNSYDNAGGVEQGVTCSTCHQVHAASSLMTYNPYLTTKILSVAAGPDYTDSPSPNWDPIAQNALSTDDSSTALTKWCAGCHFTRGGQVASYYNGDPNNFNYQSHIMTTATASTIAFKDSTYCSSCHSSEFGTSEWPHFTQGESFLESAENSTSTPTGALDSREDGVCIQCHKTGSDGVGVTF